MILKTVFQTSCVTYKYFKIFFTFYRHSYGIFKTSLSHEPFKSGVVIIFQWGGLVKLKKSNVEYKCDNFELVHNFYSANFINPLSYQKLKTKSDCAKRHGFTVWKIKYVTKKYNNLLLINMIPNVWRKFWGPAPSILNRFYFQLYVWTFHNWSVYNHLGLPYKIFVEGRLSVICT